MYFLRIPLSGGCRYDKRHVELGGEGWDVYDLP
jgi:hypothetical protein